MNHIFYNHNVTTIEHIAFINVIPLSEELIDEFANFLNWVHISRYFPLSKNIIDKHFNKLILYAVFNNSMNSTEIITYINTVIVKKIWVKQK